MTDGKASFVILNYDKLRWTTSTYAGGDTNGLGGTEAEVKIRAEKKIKDYPAFYTSFCLKPKNTQY